MSDADNQFYQLTSESTREKKKTKIIGMVKSLLNKKDLRATSSNDKQRRLRSKMIFCFNNQKTEDKTQLNS